MRTDESAALLAALQAAAAGEFKPWFYRVKVSPRKWKRYRMPGMASRVTPKEALAMQAFRLLEGCSTTEIARRFHRKRDTVRNALQRAGTGYLTN
jgi:DNA-binding NarL/FixJ family response regulator